MPSFPASLDGRAPLPSQHPCGYVCGNMCLCGGHHPDRRRSLVDKRVRFHSFSDFQFHAQHTTDNVYPPSDLIVAHPVNKGDSVACPICKRVFSGDHLVRAYNQHASTYLLSGRCRSERVMAPEVVECSMCGKQWRGEYQSFVARERS